MLEIKDFSFSFGRHELFTNLNLSFKSSHITGIVGKNGTGKTTFFRTLSGIYPVQSGQILWNGSKLMPHHVSFLPTDPYFYPYMKGQEYLQIVASCAKELEISQSYAHALELPTHNLVDNYSTGMRKKLAFAAHLAQERPVYILDEPYNGVDLESNEVIKQIIVSRCSGKTILLSSHILSTITDICHTVIYLNENHMIDVYDAAQFDLLSIEVEKSTAEKIKHLQFTDQ